MHVRVSRVLIAFHLYVLYHRDVRVVSQSGDNHLPNCRTNATSDGSEILLDLRGFGQVCHLKYVVLNATSNPEELNLLSENGQELIYTYRESTFNHINVSTVTFKESIQEKAIILRKLTTACGFIPINCKGEEKDLCLAVPCKCPFGQEGVHCLTRKFDLKVEFTGSGSIFVEWTNPPDVEYSEFDIEISRDAGFAENDTIRNVSSPHTITGLISDTVYYLRVTAQSVFTHSELRTKIRSVMILLGIPAPPVGLSVDHHNRIISWNVTYGTDYYAVCVLGRRCYNVTQTSFILPELPEDEEYRIQIFAINDIGRSKASEIIYKNKRSASPFMLWVLAVGIPCIAVLVIILVVLGIVIAVHRRKNNRPTPGSNQEQNDEPIKEAAPVVEGDTSQYEGITIQPETGAEVYSSLLKDFETSDVYANADQSSSSIPTHVQRMVTKFESVGEKDKENPKNRQKSQSVHVYENAPKKDGWKFSRPFSSRRKNSKSAPVSLVRYKPKIADKPKIGAKPKVVAEDDLYVNMPTGSTQTTEDNTTASGTSRWKSQSVVEPNSKPELCRLPSDDYYANVQY